MTPFIRGATPVSRASPRRIPFTVAPAAVRKKGTSSRRSPLMSALIPPDVPERQRAVIVPEPTVASAESARVPVKRGMKAGRTESRSSFTSGPPAVGNGDIPG